MTQQKPLELILARNLMSALSTPAFLVDEGGVLVFYNEAAGALLGKRFEELGTVGAEEWGSLFGPFGRNGEPIPYDELPLVIAVRNGRPPTQTSKSAPPTAPATRSRSRPSRSSPRTGHRARSPCSGPPAATATER